MKIEQLTGDVRLPEETTYQNLLWLSDLLTINGSAFEHKFTLIAYFDSVLGNELVEKTGQFVSPPTDRRLTLFGMSLRFEQRSKSVSDQEIKDLETKLMFWCDQK